MTITDQPFPSGRKLAGFVSLSVPNPTLWEYVRGSHRLLGISPKSDQFDSGLDGREEILPRPDVKRATTFTLLIADDHSVVREGLISVISRQPDMQVIAQAGNGREAVDKYLAERPDVCLLDLRMPAMDGIEAAIAIRDLAPEAHVIILTSYQSEEEIYRALRAGVQGYVLKETPVAQLSECIRSVGTGNKWIPPDVGAKLAKRVATRPLTIRETEVLRAMAAGKSNKEIGVALNISEGTVKVHVTHMLEKLQVTGRTEAIGVAVRRGLVRME
jgi:two-component system NarL family response regulator